MKLMLFPSYEHMRLTDEVVAKQAKRALKRRGFIGVRVVPVAGGFSVRSQGLRGEVA